MNNLKHNKDHNSQVIKVLYKLYIYIYKKKKKKGTNLGWRYCIRIEIAINVIAANMKIISLVQNENKGVKVNKKTNTPFGFQNQQKREGNTKTKN